MKQTLYLFLLLILVSCNHVARIEGIIDQGIVPENAKVVLIVSSQDSEKEIVTNIKDGRFAFMENANEPYLTTLQIEGLDPLPIYIDQGKTVVTIGVEGYEYEGTPNNTVLSSYLQLQDKEDFIAPAFQLALDNAKLPVGKDIFLDIYYLLDVEQLGQFLSRLTDEEKLNGKGKIPRVAKTYDALVASSIGKPYIDIAQPTPTGETLAISDLISKKDYLLLDFWASWCGPCRRAMPRVKEIYSQYNNRLEILGISLDNDYDAWTGAIEKLELPWKHISDLGGWDNSGAELYGVMFIPTTILISRDGTIIGRNMEEGELLQILNQ